MIAAVSPLEIQKAVHKQPFEPFRLHLSNGSSYEIPHPDFILVTRTAVYVAMDTGEDDVPAKSVICSPLHITHLEQVDGAISGESQT